MTMSVIWIMVGYAWGMACGQIMFKLAAKSTLKIDTANGPLAYLSVYLICGLVIYLGLTVLWLWVLRSIPLSKAYPFVALSFVFTPLLASVIFGEKLSYGYFIGLALIAGGIVVIARQ